MFKIVRCGAEHCLVILVTPADAGPDDDGARFYAYSDSGMGNLESRAPKEVGRNFVVDFFSGQGTQSIGEEPFRTKPFKSLDDFMEYIHQKKNKLFPYKLSRKSRHPAVYVLQAILCSMGYEDVKLTGVFDAKTEVAIMDLQEELGITVDGVMGPETRAAIAQKYVIDLDLILGPERKKRS